MSDGSSDRGLAGTPGLTSVLRRWALLSVVASLLGLDAQAWAVGPALVEVDRMALPGPLARSQDVRFDGSSALVLAVGGFGAARVSYRAGKLGPPHKLVPEGGSDGVVLASHISASPNFLVVSSSMSQLLWQSRKKPVVAGQLGTWGDPDHAPISFFEDIDLRGDQLAILGLMRSDTTMSPNGAIAWVGTLGKVGPGGVALRPIAFSSAGKGAAPSANCSISAVGKVRFLSDGRLLVIPGAEPGILFYSADGRLQSTMNTRQMGLDLTCDFDMATRLLFASDVLARLAYLNRFTTVDEVLPLASGPALILRTAGKGRTTWKMIILGADRANEGFPLPIDSTSVNDHLRGDVLGDRLVLIRNEWMREGPPNAELMEYRVRPNTALPKSPSPKNRWH